MSWYSWLGAGLAIALILWAAGVAVLVRAGRRSEARALAGFVPDCVLLLRRLLSDPRVPRGRKLALVAAIGYLAMPIDLVPDFIPVAGQLDDVIVVALLLRFVLRSAGPDVLREHWPGPPESLTLIRRLAFSR